MYLLCLSVTDDNLYISLSTIFNTELTIIYCTIFKRAFIFTKISTVQKIHKIYTGILEFKYT